MTLQNTLPPLKAIAGYGFFGCPPKPVDHIVGADLPPPEPLEFEAPLPAIEVSEDVIMQFDSEEMQALGWQVDRSVQLREGDDND